MAGLLVACSRASAQELDPATSQRAIQNKGSDTLVNLALAWAGAYREVNPDLLIAVTGGGSGTGIASLMNNTVDIANASRKMSADEIAQARAQGIEPLARGWEVRRGRVAEQLPDDETENEWDVRTLAD